MKGLHLVGLLVFFSACIDTSKLSPTYTWSSVEINDDITEEENVEAIIAPYRVKLDSVMDEVIGYAAHDLTTQGDYETTLGTFVCQLLLEQSRNIFNTQVDVSIINHHGGLRAPINKGPIKLGEVYEVMPFDNEMRLLEVPGDSLRKVINYIAQSGRSMIWPVSFDVTEAGAENIKVAEEAIDSEKTYVLSISDYLANGGSGFGMLKPLRRKEVAPILMRDMIVNEIRRRTANGDSLQVEVANQINVFTP